MTNTFTRREKLGLLRLRSANVQAAIVYSNGNFKISLTLRAKLDYCYKYSNWIKYVHVEIRLSNSPVFPETVVES